MKILVTGGAGFIGSHIVDGYLQAGHQVVVVDDLTVGKKTNLNPAATFYQIDITDRQALQALFATERPDIVNHHAAQKFLRRSVEFPAEDAMINIIGSIHLLDLATHYRCQAFIFASTAAVYGDNLSHLPFQEDYRGQPIAPYGVAKLAVEQYMSTYQLHAGLRTVAFRYANVYGPRQDGQGESGVIAIFAEQLLAGQRPKIFGTGQQTRDYIYVGDVVQANLAIIESNFAGVCNISTNTEVALIDIYHQLAELTNQTEEPVFEPAKKGDPLRLCLDNTKAQQLLDWRPTTDLKVGLQQTIEWFRAKI